ncbi:tannase and feruloyl esterase-domain-containing protein [Aspergillus parasiticus]|uniref:Carboxylic ester hydrolase n=1 Tax=Aspergillus parasiticus TaxID=5067 RepID=A0A5N6D7V1_ASPPA|nr:tannase and feruloyl esterase-domain-containing protein [Aspergillus parasiticus]
MVLSSATPRTSLGLGFGKRDTEPAQNGTVSAEAVAVAQKIVDGLHDSEGRQVYISYQMVAGFNNAQKTYNSTIRTWELDIAGAGGGWVARFLELRDEDNFSTLDGVTYDTLKGWMVQDGGKIIHFHGEQDSSIPPGSSVHYYNSVRKMMHPGKPYNESTSALKEWHRLYLVPGAAHCATNELQPNGPFPQTNFAVMAEWVEQGIVPETLNATILQGEYKGTNEQICVWPLRPLWADNNTFMCEYNQASINTFEYSFDAYKLPLY